MAGFDLRLEQKQKLIMTPELRQAIKILQLSSLELAEYINQIMLDNPLLDTQEEGNSFPDRMGSSLAELEGNPIPECEDPWV
jgi:RNA polymerase sigma-54 factor